VSDGASATLIYGPGANTVETRLDALEKNIAAIHQRIIKEIGEQSRKTADIVKREEQTRREDESTILTKLEAAATKDSCKTLIGASWILVGTFLSTLSGEIHHCIARYPYLGM
jgi:hypothetical protein